MISVQMVVLTTSVHVRTWNHEYLGPAEPLLTLSALQAHTPPPGCRLMAWNVYLLQPSAHDSHMFPRSFERSKKKKKEKTQNSQ